MAVHLSIKAWDLDASPVCIGFMVSGRRLISLSQIFYGWSREIIGAITDGCEDSLRNYVSNGPYSLFSLDLQEGNLYRSTCPKESNYICNFVNNKSLFGNWKSRNMWLARIPWTCFWQSEFYDSTEIHSGYFLLNLSLDYLLLPECVIYMLTRNVPLYFLQMSTKTQLSFVLYV